MTNNLIDVAARVVPTVDATNLILTGPDEQLTMQISADVTDIFGNVIDGAPLYYLSYSPNICTVDSSGLVTAVSEGTAVVEVSSPAGGNDAGFADNGTPLIKIYSRILVTVEPGQAVIPSFTISGSNLSAEASAGSASTALTVTPENGFVGTVYLFAVTTVSTFENNAQSVQSLATASNPPGQVIGWPLISASMTPVTWNYANAKVNITSGAQTFSLILSWNGSAPPPTGTYAFNIIGNVTPGWLNPAPLAPNVGTVSLTLTLS